MIEIYTDGGARGNPGPAAIGMVILGLGKKPLEISECIGKATNNQAEYRAVIRGLEEIQKHAIINKEINCCLDSQLIVEQLSGRYKIKSESLKPLYCRARELVIELGGEVFFHYIPRSENKKADWLLNEALDKVCYNK